MTTAETDSPPGNRTLVRAWSELRTQGYTVVTDTDLGMREGARDHLAQTFFSSEVLESDIPEVHEDRDRARDVVRYEWVGDTVTLTEHDTVELTNRSGYAGKRSHARVEVLHDSVMREWVSVVLSLVPKEKRQPRGTFGV